MKKLIALFVLTFSSLLAPVTAAEDDVYFINVKPVWVTNSGVERVDIQPFYDMLFAIVNDVFVDLGMKTRINPTRFTQTRNYLYYNPTSGRLEELLLEDSLNMERDEQFVMYFTEGIPDAAGQPYRPASTEVRADAILGGMTSAIALGEDFDFVDMVIEVTINLAINLGMEDIGENFFFDFDRLVQNTVGIKAPEVRISHGESVQLDFGDLLVSRKHSLMQMSNGGEWKLLKEFVPAEVDDSITEPRLPGSQLFRLRVEQPQTLDELLEGME